MYTYHASHRRDGRSGGGEESEKRVLNGKKEPAQGPFFVSFLKRKKGKKGYFFFSIIHDSQST